MYDRCHTSVTFTALRIHTSFTNLSQRRGTTDEETKVPSVENLELTNVLPSKPAVGENIALHARP